jgi:hypothetical protein
VIRLIAQDTTLVLTERQVLKIQYWLLEFIPATRCHVHPGPGIVIEVPDHNYDEVAPALAQRVQEIVGCPILQG